MSSLGRWHLEMQLYRDQDKPGFNPLWLMNEIRHRWVQAGRPDDGAALRELVLGAVDAMAGWFDPARLDEMRASVKLTRQMGEHEHGRLVTGDFEVET